MRGAVMKKIIQKIKRFFNRKNHIHTYGYVEGIDEQKTFKAVFDTVTFEAVN